MVGLGAMLGAGVFVAVAPAAALAGPALLIGLGLAIVVAACNAASSAQLAAARPVAGGAYVHGRERLGPWWGFAAGWCFVVGKIGSCAAIALTAAQYLVPADLWSGEGRRVLAAVAVVVLAAVNATGVRRTVAVTRVLLVPVLLALAAVVVVGWSTASQADLSPRAIGEAAGEVGPAAVAQSAALLFFAFAGYARLATLGEEVRDPRRTVPRATAIALGVVALIYGAVALAALRALGPADLADSSRPLAEVARQSGPAWLEPLVVVAAGIAALGALLGLLAGVGRTSMAMARESDLPRPLAVVAAGAGVPRRAEAAVAAVVVALVLTVDLVDAVRVSAFGVLLYYFVANAAALRQPAVERIVPRAVSVLGAVACLALVASLPVSTLLAGALVLVAGIVLRIGARQYTP